jgi:DNA-directed RNA polymerase specialized sigma24 family protein
MESLPDRRAAEEYEQILTRVTLDQALAGLPAIYGEPLRLHLLHDLSQAEVGGVLGRPRSTVATQIERGWASCAAQPPPPPRQLKSLRKTFSKKIGGQ